MACSSEGWHSDFHLLREREMAHMRAPSPSAKLPSLRCTVSLPNLSSCTYAQSTVLKQSLLSVYSACLSFAGTRRPLLIWRGPG